jgi:ABC-2 type transport system permease protein
MRTILVILRKEWWELRVDRTLLLSMLLPPLLFPLLSIVAVFALGRIPDEETAQLGAALADPSLAGMSALELGQAIIGKQFGLLFLLLPLILPNVLASYSIVGEKTRRTLEPLLASPVRTWELLAAKAIAAVLPAVILTWLAAAMFIVGVTFSAVSPRVVGAIISPAWLLVLLLCAPLLALISVAGSVAVSARVNDPRTAQQISAIVIVPFLMIFFGQLIGILVLSPSIALAAALVLAAVAALAIWGAARIFRRETILTRWK